MYSDAPVVRREFVRTALGMLAAAPFAARAFAQDTAGIEERIEFRRLVAANRILAHEEVVDAFGHVSVRDPENARRYVMARSRSPELVEYADLIRFEQDGRSLDPENHVLRENFDDAQAQFVSPLIERGEAAYGLLG